MGPVTTNPWLIALINMTIVFGVLIALGVMMSLLQVIDPTKKKADAPTVAPAPAAAPAAASNNDEIIAVIAAAVAALGCSADDIAYVRRLPNTGWTNAAIVEANTVRKECF